MTEKVNQDQLRYAFAAVSRIVTESTLQRLRAIEAPSRAISSYEAWSGTLMDQIHAILHVSAKGERAIQLLLIEFMRFRRVRNASRFRRAMVGSR